jgi:hypothetical protein
MIDSCLFVRTDFRRNAFIIPLFLRLSKDKGHGGFRLPVLGEITGKERMGKGKE